MSLPLYDEISVHVDKPSFVISDAFLPLLAQCSILQTKTPPVMTHVEHSARVEAREVRLLIAVWPALKEMGERPATSITTQLDAHEIDSQAMDVWMYGCTKLACMYANVDDDAKSSVASLDASSANRLFCRRVW